MRSASKTILLVEDRADDVDLTLRALEKNRIANEVVVCVDGLDALDFLFARGRHADRTELPELILLDLNLPRVTGLDVLRQIRADERTRRIPVVVLTSSAEDQDILSSYDLGANSFVQKPVDFSLFVEATRQLGMYWLVLNRTR
ncbi:MAG TPA: response regulator [Kofleriaceae bacterium]|nr:response regulator [Kofleriaceae bacterium]